MAEYPELDQFTKQLSIDIDNRLYDLIEKYAGYCPHEIVGGVCVHCYQTAVKLVAKEMKHG